MLTKGENLPFVVANVDHGVKPHFGYKIFFAAVCNGARDYSEVFNHGCFLSTIDYSSVTSSVPIAFVRALVLGEGYDAILNDLNMAGINDFTQTNF